MAVGERLREQAVEREEDDGARRDADAHHGEQPAGDEEGERSGHVQRRANLADGSGPALTPSPSLTTASAPPHPPPRPPAAVPPPPGPAGSCRAHGPCPPRALRASRAPASCERWWSASAW